MNQEAIIYYQDFIKIVATADKKPEMYDSALNNLSILLQKDKQYAAAV